VNPSKISIFGLGYVGSVTAACLAESGCQVWGCDVAAAKVDQINAGTSPISEPGLDDLVRANVDAGRLRATTDAVEAIAESEISIICVGTPSQGSGALDLRFVETVAGEIADALRSSAAAGAADAPAHVVIFRSTMLPGSTRRMAETLFADLIDGGRVEIFFYPEFLRQGSAIADFADPSLAAIGALDEKASLEKILSVVAAGDDCEVVSLETAELLKYSCNAFHAAKVSFANEIGRIGKAVAVDSSVVMSLLCRDERLNISPYYLRPGTPYGGSCLPKDVSALKRFARSLNVSTPTLDSLSESNQQHLEHLIERIERRGSREVVLLGLAFKAGTDDLRGSAMLETAAALLLRDYRVRIFDPVVSPANLVGANERFAALKLPQLDSLLCADLDAALSDGATLVVSKACVELEELRSRTDAGHHFIDVAHWTELRDLEASYEGICW
jgi:GDP-mannose 6-dehydrogenase